MLRQNPSTVELEDALLVANEIHSSQLLAEKSQWLITGASGFLGSQCLLALRALRQIGYEIDVCAIDSGFRGSIRSEYFSDVNFVKFDVTDPWDQINFLPDYIIHLASIASPVYYREFPLETIKVNFLGSLNALNFAKNTAASILLMSSSEIYGDPPSNEIPTREEYRGNVSTIGPRACYDEGKRITESLGWIYREKFNVKVSIARPFNVFGPGMRLDDGRVIPDFLSAVINEGDITVYSDGSPTRSFCYSADAVTALFKIVLKQSGPLVLNIGNDKTECSVRELSEHVRSVAIKFGWNGNIVFKRNIEAEYLINNPFRRVPNIDLVIKSIDWKPKFDLVNGIERSLRHYLEKKEN